MQYTTLGRTGLAVSRLCLGCMSYGLPSWRPWVLDEERAQPFFQRAIELGINFFDTADMYSLGVSEEITGRALRKYGRLDEIVIATKVYYPTSAPTASWNPGGQGSPDPPNASGLGRKHVVQACEASLKRLGVETIDLYQLHRVDPGTPLEETLEALDLLVRQGKVRYIGCSSTWAWKLMKALAYSDAKGIARFVSMQNHYNLVYREEEREMLPLCIEQGVGVIPWSPLARGLLARAKDGGTPRASGDAKLAGQLYDHPSDSAVVEANRKLAAARGVSPAETALAWLLSRPGVVAPIIGATKMEHLEAAVRALDLGLSDEEVKTLEDPYQPHAVRGWIRA
ncbi:MAG TPA: aldo/keto reductase [Candidatus Eisenbacteria bacterium]|nr:aldo/keto reductase [Candidatus Eisenbacteria bacterium]